MKKIYINPGHSDTDPGAVGFERERDLNVQVAEYMDRYLRENYSVQVVMNPGTMGNLYAICKDANDWGADLFVSIHFNAGGGDGFEALVYSENRRSLGDIFDKYVKEIGQNSRGVKLRPGLVVLRDTNMPAVLCEGAFVDNQKDIEDWNEEHELRKLGVAYAKAAAEYLGLEAEPYFTMDYAQVPVLDRGCEGKPVEVLQQLLPDYNDAIDGVFGPVTEQAVLKFQKQRGLKTNGEVAGDTWAALIMG